MAKRLVLMYHALYADAAERAALASHERPYALSVEQFQRQLDCLQQHAELLPAERHAEAPQSERLEVLLTFDDGHLSNARLAAPLLAERGLSAVFFMTANFIAEDPNFCTWADVKALHRQGHVIGAHGASHGFFSQMDAATLAFELAEPVRQAKAQAGIDIDSLSFPGGRYSRQAWQMAYEAGYRQVYGSRFGLQESAARQVQPRMAIRHNTGVDEVRAMVQRDRGYYAKHSALDTLKRWAKTCIGDSGYDQLYQAAARLAEARSR